MRGRNCRRSWWILSIRRGIRKNKYAPNLGITSSIVTNYGGEERHGRVQGTLMHGVTAESECVRPHEAPAPYSYLSRSQHTTTGRWRSWLSHLSNIRSTEGPQFDPGPTHIVFTLGFFESLCFLSKSQYPHETQTRTHVEQNINGDMYCENHQTGRLQALTSTDTNIRPRCPLLCLSTRNPN